jgi:hypothetical protein
MGMAHCFFAFEISPQDRRSASRELADAFRFLHRDVLAQKWLSAALLAVVYRRGAFEELS